MKTSVTPNLDDCHAALLVDGRTTGLVLPITLARECGFVLVPNRSGHLLRDHEGLLWKARVITDHIDFGSSNTKGTGRGPSVDKWIEGTRGLAGFIIADQHSPNNPELPIYPVSLAVVEQWRDGRPYVSLSRREILARLREARLCPIP